jgi:DNA-binding MarR family transcriptional regulator
MDYSILARILAALDDIPLHLPTIADVANVDAITAIAALHVLSRRGLAVLRHSAYALPAGMTPSQAQVVLLLGERGALSVSELTLLLGRQDPDMHADLRHLAAMGRVEKYGGAWQLACGMSAATARAIAFALDRRHDAEGR